MSQPDLTVFLDRCRTLLSAGAVLPADRLPPYAASCLALQPPGGAPLGFVTPWGGVGLFPRRLVLPILARYAPPAASRTD